MNSELNFDVAVLGGGPGGYPAAIRASQLGMRVALIENGKLGGTCLNCGCIPTKILTANAEALEKIKEAEKFGIYVDHITFDYKKMLQRKDETVQRIRKGLEGLIQANPNIEVIRGYGKFLSPSSIKVSSGIVINAKKIIIATGSEPRNISKFPFDGKKIHNSTTLLELEELPESLAIIGGGVIGCEFASIFQALGVKVTIIEMMPEILPMEPSSVSFALTKAFKKKGIALKTNAVVTAIEETSKGVAVKLSESEAAEAQIALVAVGRTLNTSNIGLEKAGVLLSESGMVLVDDKMETNVPGIYAVGDIASKWWLAHVASHQGLVAGSNAAGIDAFMHYTAVPSVIYTNPEIASVGLSLEDALKTGYPAVLAAFPFQVLGKSQATLQTEGFAQIVVDKTTGQILGAQVVGHEASALIAEMGVAITNELTIESVTATIHAHPSISEAWLEAALLAENMPLHLPKPFPAKVKTP